MGARAGGGTVAQVDALEQFGYHLGVANQILDDVAGTWHPADGQDIRHGRVALPLLYALKVLSTEECCHLRDKVGKARTGSGGYVDLQTQLLESGALHYLLIEVARHRQAAEEALQAVKASPLVDQQLRNLWAGALPGQVVRSLTTKEYVDQGQEVE
jgi:geranylgeranyl pyrophosphate synthase